MSTNVYRKKINIFHLIPIIHPMAHKNAVVRTLFHRAKMVCSSLPERVAEEVHITKTLKENGYPSSVITKNNRTHPKLPKPSQEIDKPAATVILSYIGNTFESIKRVLALLNIRTCFKPHKTLRELLVHPKDFIQDNQKKGVVYSIPCEDCDSVYVGQTGRTLEHRMKEHKRALCLLDDNISAVAEHSIKQEHRINWENAKVVARRNLTHQRCFLESWFISQKPIMNRDDGALPRVYNSLI